MSLKANSKSKKNNVPTFYRPRKTTTVYLPSKELAPGSTVMRNNTWVIITTHSEKSEKYLKNNFENSEKYKCYEFDENKLLNYKFKDYDPKLSFVSYFIL